MRKTVQRWAVLVAVVLLFASFDAGMYVTVTQRCRNNFGNGFSGKMIEPESFLPFAEKTNIVREKSGLHH